MSAQRLALHNLLRQSRIATVPHHTPVQTAGANDDDEQLQLPPVTKKLSDSVIPLLNLPFAAPQLQFNASLTAATLVRNALKVDSEAVEKTSVFTSLGHGDLLVQRKRSVPTKQTCEVSVQTDCVVADEHGLRMDTIKWQLETQIGEELLAEGKSREAVARFKKAAENGNVEAAHHLAECLYHGDGAPKNEKEALRLWQSASRSGHADSLYQLACARMQGGGANAEKACVEMRRAGEMGSADAAFYLGVRALRNTHWNEAELWLAKASVEDEYLGEMRGWLRDGCLSLRAAKLVNKCIAHAHQE